MGQYKLRTGLGLILNTRTNYGKLYSTSTASSSTNVIVPHLSRSSETYLQGIAATLGTSKKWDVTLFASYKLIDGTLTSDSTGIRTIVTTGYHNTEATQARKNNSSQTTFGLNARYLYKHFVFGLTALTDHYSLPLKPYTEGSSSAQLYRRFYPTGADFWNLSFNYGYKFYHTVRFEGEVATGDCGKVATVNSISWQVNRYLTLYSLYRYYPYQFTATLGNAFSEAGRNQDEQGLYLGVNWQPKRGLTISAYSDASYMVWPKYQALGSSRCWDNQIQISLKQSYKTTYTMRYRYKARQKNGEEAGELVYKHIHRLQAARNWGLGAWSAKTQVSAIYSSYLTNSAGVMLYQQGGYTRNNWLFNAGFGGFKTKDYSSAIYLYEKNTPYSMTSSILYGTGLRGSAFIRRTFFDKLNVYLKAGLTWRQDTQTYKSDAELMVKVNY